MKKTLTIAGPVGFCGGVRLALERFRRFQEQAAPAPVHVLHELVHNTQVTEAMKASGAVFVDSPAHVPEGGHLLIGAHGCGSSDEAICVQRRLIVEDATCPLVKKLRENMFAVPRDIPIIHLGSANHPEVRGILDRLTDRTVRLVESPEEAQALPHWSEAAFFSQTTRNIMEIELTRDILRHHTDILHDHAKVCEAVSERQKAMRHLANTCDSVIIVGSQHSSNARQLAQIATASGKARVYFAESENDIRPEDFSDTSSLVLGTATSTSDSVISAIITKLNGLGFETISCTKQ